MGSTFTKMITHASIIQKLFLAFFLIFLIASCNSKPQEAEEQKLPASDSVALANPTQTELNSDQSTVLTTILGPNSLTPESIIRGIKFADPISKVKATETFEMFEEDESHLGYTVDTPQLETIDIQYFLTKDKKVSHISVDVYLNSKEATKQLWEASKKHFSGELSNPRESANELSWNNKTVRVTMKDVSSGKEFGLNFEFFPAGSTALAKK